MPALFDVRVRTRENTMTLEALQRLGITPRSVSESLDRSTRGWLCEDSGRVVAFTMADRATGEFLVIAVLPEYEGKGIGGRLMALVEEWLAASGCTRAWLTTDLDPSLRAYGFYRKRGWTDWKIEGGLRWMQIALGNPAPLYVRLLAGLVRPFPNFDFGFIKPVRQKAAALLRLRPGDRVLDVGCGSGGAFPFLVHAVGPAGKVVGVEVSPVSAAHARHRAAVNSWSHVEVVQASAERARLEGPFDGLLMFAAPDIYASDAMLGILMRHLRPGARVVFFGNKVSNRRFGWMLNPALAFAMKRLSLPTTPGMEAEPWKVAAAHLDEFEVEECFHGWMFLAAGTFNPPLAPAPSRTRPTGARRDRKGPART